MTFPFEGVLPGCDSTPRRAARCRPSPLTSSSSPWVVGVHARPARMCRWTQPRVHDCVATCRVPPRLHHMVLVLHAYANIMSSKAKAGRVKVRATRQRLDSNPKPKTQNPKPQTSNLKPQAPSPKPQTSNQTPCTSALKPCSPAAAARRTRRPPQLLGRPRRSGMLHHLGRRLLPPGAPGQDAVRGRFVHLARDRRLPRRAGVRHIRRHPLGAAAWWGARWW
jgi:hypothetical protein